MAYTSATSNNASLGKACVANGKPVLGNGYDVWTVKKQIENGKAGIAEAITTAGVDTAADDSFEQMATNILLLKPTPPNPDDYEVVITYHKHTGNSTQGGGCYTKVISTQTGECKTVYSDTGVNLGCNDPQGHCEGKCSICGDHWQYCQNRGGCSVVTYGVACGKTTSTIESYKVYYKGEDVTN